VAEAAELLRLMGIPTVQAPSEGEAQAAHMAATSPRVWAAASKDYDSLLFGAPRLVRFLGIAGKEFLPSQGTFRPIVPETIEFWQNGLFRLHDRIVFSRSETGGWDKTRLYP